MRVDDVPAGRHVRASPASTGLRLSDCSSRFTNEENISGKSQVKSSVQRGIKQSILDQYPGLEEEIEELLPKKEPLFVAKWCAPSTGHRGRVCTSERATCAALSAHPLPFQPALAAQTTSRLWPRGTTSLLSSSRCATGHSSLRYVCSTSSPTCSQSTGSTGGRSDLCSRAQTSWRRGSLRKGARWTTCRRIQSWCVAVPCTQIPMPRASALIPRAPRGCVAARSSQGIFAEGKEHALAIGVTMTSTQEIRDSNKGVSVENTHYLNDGLWHLMSIE